MKDYTRSITENKQLIEELKAESASLTKDTDIATTQLHQVREENIKLGCSVDELQHVVVTEDEIKTLEKYVFTIFRTVPVLI